jgi:cell division protein FtsQ
MTAACCNSHVAVAKKLRESPVGLTMQQSRHSLPDEATVSFRSQRNRRRIDVAKRTGELKAVAQNHGPVVLKLLGLTLAFGAIAFGAFEGWKWALTSSHFALSGITVTGQVEATDVELLKLGGVQLGQNLIAMDLKATEKAIATHPWVKSVRVTRRFPSRLTVEVEEHRAVAMLSLGDLYLVNEEAEPFKRIKAGDGFDVPLITGVDRDLFAQPRADGSSPLRSALALLEAYQAQPEAKAQPVSEVNLHPEGVTVVTTNGQAIEFGEGDVAAKLSRLARIRKEMHARSLVAEVIRLDNRTRPAWVAVQVAAKKP